MGDWLYVLAIRQKFTVNVVIGLLGNKSSDLNRFIPVTPESENDARLQATLDSQNPKEVYGSSQNPTEWVNSREEILYFLCYI